MTHNEIVPILQISIGPVILISGVGLLLLTITNRFGRMLDRSRQLKQQQDQRPDPATAADIRAQIDILMRRASILRLSITLGTFTVLFDAVLMLMLFLSAALKLEWTGTIATVFCLALLCLIGSMVAFILDMNLALRAVRLEIKPVEN